MVIPLGRVVKAKLVQFENAPTPILVIPLGRVVKAKLVQSENAPSLIALYPYIFASISCPSEL